MNLHWTDHANPIKRKRLDNATKTLTEVVILALMANIHAMSVFST